MSEKRMKTGSFLAGTLVGGLVGAAVALLYAPRSGEETRTVIREKSVEVKDLAVEKGEEIRQQAMEAAGQARSRLNETSEATKARAAELQSKGQAFLDEQREKITKVIETGKTSLKSKTGQAENGVKITPEA